MANLVAGDTRSPMHRCKGMAGLLVPLIARGVRADLRPVEREDYVGKEIVRVDANGRPIMAVKTIRNDGEDCHVFAPTARTSVEE
jgi:hypothetical protein